MSGSTPTASTGTSAAGAPASLLSSAQGGRWLWLAPPAGLLVMSTAGQVFGPVGALLAAAVVTASALVKLGAGVLTDRSRLLTVAVTLVAIAGLITANLLGWKVLDAPARGPAAQSPQPSVAGTRQVHRGATLDRADLQRRDFYDADFSGATLFGARLQNSDLREAQLRGADLRGASLSGACLDGADLRGAVVDATTVVEGAHLATAKLPPLSADLAVRWRAAAASACPYAPHAPAPTRS